MTNGVTYHINEQQADALIGPLHNDLRELENRTRHYIDHLRMAEGDRELLESSLQTIQTARQEIEGLHRASVTSR